MSHENPQSPGISPCSPTKGHRLDSVTANTLPPLATSMPLRRSSVIQYVSPVQQSPRNPLGLTIENRKQSIPNLQASIDIVMNTPISPKELLSFPPRSPSSDGRHSRMDVRSPILDKVVALPLRLNTAIAGSSEPMTCYSPSEMDYVPSTNDNPTPETRWLPSHSRMLPVSRSHISTISSATTPSSISPRARTRSPIRKRTSPGRTVHSQSPRSSSHSRLRTSPRSYTPPPRSRLSRTSSPKMSHQPQTQPQCEHLRRVQNRQQQQPHSQSSPRGFHPTYIPTLTHLRTPLVPLISVSTGLSHPDFPRSLLQYHLLTHDQLDSLARWYHQVSPPSEETFRYPTWIPPWTTTTPRNGPETGDDGPATKRTKRTGDIVNENGQIGLEAKRRRWGRFMGLRGCESPVLAGENGGFESAHVVGGDSRGGSGGSGGGRGERRTTTSIPQSQPTSDQTTAARSRDCESADAVPATATATAADEEGLVERMEREWRNALRKAEEEEMLQQKAWRGRY